MVIPRNHLDVEVDDCFVHGCLLLSDVSIKCVTHSFQDVSFFNHYFWSCHYGFLTFPCLWEISFSSQVISGTISWLLDLDRIFK